MSVYLTMVATRYDRIVKQSKQPAMPAVVANAHCGRRTLALAYDQGLGISSFKGNNNENILGNNYFFGFEDEP